ncbi:MAG: alpha/beta fold hydrolase [Frankiales bacterium]|nr:alpha/beta fold hydrolase [Frankiales bacterium]
MSLAPEAWSRAYLPLRPRSLAIQLVVLVLAECALFASYDVHDARFHWATHFLVALGFTSLLLLARLLVTGAPGPRPLLMLLLGLHLYAMAPDLLFFAGVVHAQWMNVFLGHVASHYLPGGDGTWLVLALLCTGAYVAALTLWLRARGAEAAAGLPPGVGLTGLAVLRPQRDPRVVPLAVSTAGGQDGQSLVLLHGLGASSSFWAPVAVELAGRGARTLAPDLLGFGASLRLGTHFHLDDQAAAVIRLIEGGGPVVLVAHSYGAAVAVEVARARPDLVARLVLVSPAAFADAAQARDHIGGRSWLARQTMRGAPVAGLVCGTMCLLRRPLTGIAPTVARRTTPVASAAVARAATTHLWPAYRDAVTSLLDSDGLVSWLARPGLPTTVLVAADDPTVLAADLTPLLGPGVRVMTVAGTHLLPLEDPVVVAAAVLA